MREGWGEQRKKGKVRQTEGGGGLKKKTPERKANRERGRFAEKVIRKHTSVTLLFTPDTGNTTVLLHQQPNHTHTQLDGETQIHK